MEMTGHRERCEAISVGGSLTALAANSHVAVVDANPAPLESPKVVDKSVKVNACVHT